MSPTNEILQTQGAAFVAGAVATFILRGAWIIASHEIHAWIIRRRYKINRLEGRSIVHRI